MFIQKKNTLSELVADDYRLASVFKTYGIDYFCRGERTIQEVCESKNIERKLLVDALNNATTQSNTDILDFHSWPINELAAYIEQNLHSYVKAMAPVVIEHLYILCKEYGDLRPELPCIMELFTKVFKKIENHNNKESFVLFPYIRKIECIRKDCCTVDSKYLGIMQVHMQNIIQENNFEGQYFLEIRELCNNYITENQISSSYNTVLELLNDFESKLELQLHLENNLLFPKALELENTLIKKHRF